jgi:hypothetical protein
LEMAKNYWDEMGRGNLADVHTELHRTMTVAGVSGRYHEKNSRGPGAPRARIAAGHQPVAATRTGRRARTTGTAGRSALPQGECRTASARRTCGHAPLLRRTRRH